MTAQDDSAKLATLATLAGCGETFQKDEQENQGHGKPLQLATLAGLAGCQETFQTPNEKIVGNVGRLLATFGSNLPTRNPAPGAASQDPLATLAGFEELSPNARTPGRPPGHVYIARACGRMSGKGSTQPANHANTHEEPSADAGSGVGRLEPKPANNLPTTCHPPGSRPNFPHLKSLLTPQEFHSVGILAAAWAEKFSSSGSEPPEIIDALRRYSDRALSRWADSLLEIDSSSPLPSPADAMAGSPRPDASPADRCAGIGGSRGSTTGQRAPRGGVGGRPAPALAPPGTLGPADPGEACPACRLSTAGYASRTACRCEPCPACEEYPEFCGCGRGGREIVDHRAELAGDGTLIAAMVA